MIISIGYRVNSVKATKFRRWATEILNNYLLKGEAKINDNALASLALLVATSAPEQKEIIIKLIMNMLVD